MKACWVLLFLIFAFFGLPTCISQNITGIPNIINFSKYSYNAGTQNRSIIQDNNGFIYFANNEGLLRFDGTFWKLYPFPNKLIVRCIAIAKDNMIYAAGQNDFGYFSPDKNGILKFTSLKNLLSEADASFNYVWDVVSFADYIFFRSRDKLFQYNHNSVKVYQNDNRWLYLGTHQNHLIAEDGKNQLLKFTGTEWKPFLKTATPPENFLITSIIHFGKDSSLITTRKGKAYILANDIISDFKFEANDLSGKLLLCATAVSEDLIAIGTDLGGCYFVNKKGQVIQNISRKDGLQNNTVISVFLDKRKNLWLGLDNGIDLIATNNGIKEIYPEKLNEGFGYSSIIYNDQLYIGTSYGLFKAPLSAARKETYINNLFTFVPNTAASVWNLTDIDGNLLMANHMGAFIVKNDSAIPINTTTGYWSFLPLRKDEKSTVIIAGFYTGLELYEYKESSFKSLGALQAFSTSPRSMVLDKNQSLWVATSFNGIYKIDFDKELKPTYKKYTEASGLPSLLRNRICKIKNQIFSATEKGIYQYNPQKDMFEVSPFYNYFFKGKDIRLLKEDNEGNVWFIEGKNVGFIDLKENKKTVLYFPELDGKIISGNSLEYIMPYNRYNTFVGSEKGFFQINLEDYKKNNNVPQVKIISAGATGNVDSLFFGGYFGNVNEVGSQSKTAIPEINSSLNSLHFEYSSPSYSYESSIQYSYILDGFDKQWSVWTRNAQKDYTNLPPGTFTFKVKGKTSLGEESTVDSYTFTILATWYRTWWAYLLYCLIIAALVYLAYKEQKKLLLKQQRKYEEEQKRQQYLHKLELENSEKEIIALRNEKLKAELEGKNSELASVAMQMVHKGEILSKVKDELVRLRKVSDEDGSDDFKKLIKAIKEEDKMDEEWKQFATHFDNIHGNFTKALKNAYPTITQNEIKLSTYLYMNLSSKEIAQLLNISVRGVEISRYRLRKKLQIPTEINLNQYFQNFNEKEGNKPSLENQN